MFMNLFVVIFVFSLSCVFCVDPPIYDYSFRVSFDQTVVENTTSYKVNGQLFYDPKNNRERVDRTNGRYDLFCGTVLPNVTTPCTQYTSKNKRFIAFPQRQQCCFCCESTKGCGILKPDWMVDGKYLGRKTIVDTEYDQWSKDGVFGYNYLYVTTDANKIMRQLDENGQSVYDYRIPTFVNQTFPDSVFALPAYCNEANPTNCALTSFCGKLRLSSQQK